MAQTITVSAAASLTNALTDIGKAFSKVNPEIEVRFNFGASGALAQQITAGAPVDVFIPASTKEMETLISSGNIDTKTRLDFAGNRLVLIASINSPVKTWTDLKLPSVKRIALSDPASVPSGRYAKETLIKRGIWASVEKKAVLGQNVRQTLAYVANGDVAAGIVFTTDAMLEAKRVRIVAEAVPGKDHSPIVYPAAIVSRSQNAPIAQQFIQFLKSPTARVILSHYGFKPL